MSLPIPTPYFTSAGLPFLPNKITTKLTEQNSEQNKQKITNKINHNPFESHRESPVNTGQPPAAESQWHQKRAEYSASHCP